MKAPSEQHLQDYIMSHPECLGSCTGQYEDEIYLDYDIFKREATLPAGRADFLAISLDGPSYSICVIETKKEELTSKSLAQCLRYMRDIRHIWDYAIYGLPEPDSSGIHYVAVPKISGLLIGKSITDDILISADGANVSVMTYEFGDYTHKSSNWCRMGGWNKDRTQSAPYWLSALLSLPYLLHSYLVS